MLLPLTGRPGCLSQGRMVLGLPHRPLPHCQKYPIAGSHVCCQPSGSRPQIDGIWGASSYARDALGSGQTPARSEQQSAVPWPPRPCGGPSAPPLAAGCLRLSKWHRLGPHPSRRLAGRWPPGPARALWGLGLYLSSHGNRGSWSDELGSDDSRMSQGFFGGWLCRLGDRTCSYPHLDLGVTGPSAGSTDQPASGAWVKALGGVHPKKARALGLWRR